MLGWKDARGGGKEAKIQPGRKAGLFVLSFLAHCGAIFIADARGRNARSSAAGS
jgi:hypothetical protein